MVRLFAGIVFGYVFFALTAILIFQLSGRAPHAAAEPAFMVGSIGAGIIGALTAGYIGAAIAKEHERGAGVVIALLIAAGAAISLLAQPDEGSEWSQYAALLLMSPAVLLGAFIRFRRLRGHAGSSRGVRTVERR